MRGEYDMPVFWISAAALVFLLEVLIPLFTVGIPLLLYKLKKWRNRK